MTNRKPLSFGFTLIELLIVVAIIAILAAIAVPNFLEAQTRAKVSRVKADMRSLATAVESYIVDNNKLFPTGRAVGQSRTFIWSYLTTPIAYFTSIPQDPFNNKDADSADRVIVLWGPDFIQGYSPARTINHKDGQSFSMGDASARGAQIFSPYSDIVTQPYTASGGSLARRDFWAMVSFGPDQVFQVNVPSFPGAMTPYDPTNGTVSDGDLVRLQGSGDAN